MKIKELQKIVNISWSPIQQDDIYLAAGTAAQQLDISSNSVLELYSINLSDPSYDMVLKGSQAAAYRFHKILWSPLNIGDDNKNGIIVTGCESGHLQVYSASKLLAGTDALIAQQNKHTGPVRSLDYNSFQSNLLASGASESEIFIWDLNNTLTAMTPGAKSQPFEDIQNVSWNKQVQHILASVYSSRCVIRDLRKNEPIIKLTDSQSRVRWRAIQWHPEIATQLWLASEDDQAPVVQLWDLRYATAPTKTLHIHNRGILGLSWCTKDTDLMVSCGKDNKILCWNPNAENENDQILSEVASTIYWYSDVLWCPKNPAIIASSSLDGNVSIYSLFGGQQQQVQTTNKIADSFPGMDTFAQAPVPQNTTQIIYSDLKKPPKWMKKPIGASFGFGGKLITFKNNTEFGKVTIKQLVTEPTFVERSNKLEEVLEHGNFIEYCRQKADETTDQNGRYIWYFLKANFEQNPRAEMLNLLGYNSEDMSTKFKQLTDANDNNNNDNNNNTNNSSNSNKDVNNGLDHITDKMGAISRSDSSEVEADRSSDDSTDLSIGDHNAVFDAITADQKALNDENKINDINFKIKIDDSKEGQICQALLTGNIEAAVELCMQSGRTTDAIIIALSGGTELLARTQYRYLKNSEGNLSQIISALVTQDWMGVIGQCSVNSWKEALVAVLTHSGEQMSMLCERLGERLQNETEISGEETLNHKLFMQNALLCFICAGNIERFIDTWPTIYFNSSEFQQTKNPTIKELQELVEIVMILQKSIELQGRTLPTTGQFATLLTNYAKYLTQEGQLNSALTYLGSSTDDLYIDELRERLYYSLGHKQAYRSIGSNLLQQQQQQQQHQQQTTNRFFQPRKSITNTIVPPLVGTQTQQSQQFNFNTTTMGTPPTFMSSSQQQQFPPPPPPPTSSSMLPPVPTWNNQLQQTQSNTNVFAPPPITTMQPTQSKAPIGPPPQINDLMQPTRPSSVGPQGTTTLKSKHVLDPSVQGGPMYGQSVNSFVPPVHQLNANFNVQPLQTSNILNNNQTQFNQFNNQPITNFKPNNFMDNSNQYMSSLPPPPPIEVAQQAMTSAQRNPTPPPGWNDPPALKPRQLRNDNMSAEHAGTRKWNQIIKSRNNKQEDVITKNLKYPVQQPTPKPENQNNVITHPLFGQTDYYDQNANQYYQPPNQQQQQPMMMPQLPTQINYSSGSMYPQSQHNQENFYQPQHQQQLLQQQQQQLLQQQQQQQQQPQKTITPEPPKQKLPLPEEYVYMQTVFTELINQCTNSTPNLQIKRKLEDVTKRLEFLYDMLRENRLSTNTITLLNQLVQLVQIGDYQNGLVLHTQMVSGPDFSQIANFMPGIKVLLQLAMQLQVYLR